KPRYPPKPPWWKPPPWNPPPWKPRISSTSLAAAAELTVPLPARFSVAPLMLDFEPPSSTVSPAAAKLPTASTAPSAAADDVMNRDIVHLRFTTSEAWRDSADVVVNEDCNSSCRRKKALAALAAVRTLMISCWNTGESLGESPCASWSRC